MSVQLVVFDIAGTTLKDENNVASAFQKAFSLNGIAIRNEVIVPLMGYHKPEAIRKALEKTGSAANADIVDDIYADFEDEMIAYYETDPGVKPMQGAEEIFQLLKKRNIRVALNTGFSARIADVIVSRFLWEDKGLIDDFIGSDEVKMGRPYPFMIEALMLRNNIKDVGEVAKVGDTVVDMEEGKNAGCAYVIGVTTGAATQAELVAANPTHIIHHLSALSSIL